MSTLAEFQMGFVSALRTEAGTPQAGPLPCTLAAMPGFAVYRNTVMKACVDALEANFPTVTRLVGNEWMRAAAAVHAHAELPDGPMLLGYGATFPAFLATFEPAADLPWLPVVATLDRLWIESHAAADAAPLDAAHLAAIERSALLDVRLQPHPTARWAGCSHSPVYTIWSRNRDGSTDEGEIDWLPEFALITRPQEVVLHRVLGPAGLAFMDACAAGRTLGEATLAALDAEPAADLPALVGSLLEAGAFAALPDAGAVSEHGQASHPSPLTDPCTASTPPTPTRGTPEGKTPPRNARPPRQPAGPAQPHRRPPRPLVRP